MKREPTVQNLAENLSDSRFHPFPHMKNDCAPQKKQPLWFSPGLVSYGRLAWFDSMGSRKTYSNPNQSIPANSHQQGHRLSWLFISPLYVSIPNTVILINTNKTSGDLLIQTIPHSDKERARAQTEIELGG